MAKIVAVLFHLSSVVGYLHALQVQWLSVHWSALAKQADKPPQQVIHTFKIMSDTPLI